MDQTLTTSLSARADSHSASLAISATSPALACESDGAILSTGRPLCKAPGHLIKDVRKDAGCNDGFQDLKRDSADSRWPSSTSASPFRPQMVHAMRGQMSRILTHEMTSRCLFTLPASRQVRQLASPFSSAAK